MVYVEYERYVHVNNNASSMCPTRHRQDCLGLICMIHSDDMNKVMLE